MKLFSYYWLLNTLILTSIFCDKELFFDLEHPVVAYIHPDYLSNLTIKSVRYSRSDPVHHLNIYFTNVTPIDKSIQVEINYNELVANTYRTTFIQFHYSFCYLLEKDELIGVFFRNAIKRDSQSNGLLKCPVSPGSYKIANVSFPRSPLIKRVTFRKGRIVFNMTTVKYEPIGNGYIDFEIRPYKKH